MIEPVNIGQNYGLANLSCYAEKVVTEKGNVYFRFPGWFQQLPGNFEFVIHTDMPEDLSKFICKAGLGGENPKPIKPEL